MHTMATKVSGAAVGSPTKIKFGDVVQLNRERVADHQAEGIERYIGIEYIEPGDLSVRS